MIETKIYCDHCHKELNEMHDYTDIEIDTIESYVHCDLCPDCVALLHKTVLKFVNKGEETK